jgi:hypothetical protein
MHTAAENLDHVFVFVDAMEHARLDDEPADRTAAAPWLQTTYNKPRGKSPTRDHTQ